MDLQKEPGAGRGLESLGSSRCAAVDSGLGVRAVELQDQVGLQK